MEALQRLHNRGSISTGYNIDNSFVQEYNNARRVSMYYGGFGGSAPTNTKATISFWFKWAGTNAGGANWKMIDTQNSQFGVMPEGGTYDSSIYCAGQNESLFKLVSTAKFRDTSAWYHMCAVFDSTLSTASDRVKIYVNGVRVTDFTTANYPAQNASFRHIGENTTHHVGHDVNAGKPYAYYADMYYIFDQAKDVTDFGEFDEDTGIWKPIEYTGTFGSYGYYWDFSNASNYAEDQSGTASGTSQMTEQSISTTTAMQSTDTPTNNFCLINTLQPADQTVTNGATVWSNTVANSWRSSVANTGVNNGKWYYEITIDTGGYNMVGITGENGINTLLGTYLGASADATNASYGYLGNGVIYNNAGTPTTGLPTFGGGNIISCALDMDNGYVYFAKNGSWINSGDPTSGSSGTGGWALYDSSETQFFASSIYGSSDTLKYNFGGFYFTTISTAETDANGYGTFEYAPPTGYYALCSKNLAEFG